MSMLSVIQDEFNSRGFVNVPYSVERFTISFGCHLLNTLNLESRKFWHMGCLENFRTNIVYMTPSGFSKTTYMKLFIGKSGILGKSGIPMSVRSTFSTESWLGTVHKDKKTGEVSVCNGIFSKYKNGIVGADDFMRLKEMMDGVGIKHDEVYLMSGLESDTATKDLSYGSIEEEGIGTTLWCGIRPIKISLISGLARRFSFQLFFPSVEDVRNFKYAGRDKRIKTPISDKSKDNVCSEVDYIKDSFKSVDSIQLSVIEDWVNGNTLIPHFEENIYKRIAVGYSVVSGSFPDIKIDKTLEGIFLNEFYNRHVIREDPKLEMVWHVIDSSPDIKRMELLKFLVVNYQISMGEAEWLINKLRLMGRIEGIVDFKTIDESPFKLVRHKIVPVRRLTPEIMSIDEIDKVR